ncbi:MAG TPA: hypothetical protein VM389_03770 [Phycisphaerae bacterium]|nr:hypothetical protein [Phycisphaerae bacterium]HUU60102.1 hypothetical protein [Phycisphaerae bacterium]
MAETPGTEFTRSVHVDQRDKSAGFRSRCGFFKSFDAGPDTKSLYDISFPYAVDLMQGDYWIPSTVNPKNRLWVEVAPNTNLDLLVSGAACDGAVASGDSEVVLNAQAKGALDAMLTNNGDMQTEEVYFRLTSVPGDETDFTNLRKARWDSANSKLVSPDGSAFGLTASDADDIFITVRWEDGSYLAPGEFVRMGDETLGSSQLPANTKIRFIMLNEDGSAVDVGFNLTYLHN